MRKTKYGGLGHSPSKLDSRECKRVQSVRVCHFKLVESINKYAYYFNRLCSQVIQ